MAVDQKVSKYMREHGPATDWYLRAEGAERAFNALRQAIEGEGYEVLHDISDDTYSVRPREGHYVDEAEYVAASPAVQKAMRHFWRCSGELDAEKITAMKLENARMHYALQFIASQEALTFAECSVAEEIVRRAKAALP